MKTIIFIFLLLNAFSAFSEEEGHGHEESDKSHEHSEEGHKGEEEHKGEEGHKSEESHEEAELPAGITSFDDEKAEFSLKANVIKNFGIGSQIPSVEGNVLKLPATSIVKSLNLFKVFIQKNNTFTSVEIKVIRSEGSYSFVAVKDELKSASIVSEGTNFLQTIMLSLEEGPSEGHGH